VKTAAVKHRHPANYNALVTSFFSGGIYILQRFCLVLTCSSKQINCNR